MKNRYNKILEILIREGKADVSALSNNLKVSQVTIRKDLDYLEENGIVKRAHGYALLSSNNDIATRLAYHYDTKLKIAKVASSTVQDGEVIMIESGSCCALLALELAKAKKDITIITNSVFISDFVRKVASFEIVLLGGTYQKDSQAIVGPMVRECVKNFWADRFFIGIDGYGQDIGFTNNDRLRSQAVRDMALQTNNVCILTESEKFSKYGNTPINIDNKIKYIFTDDKIKETTKSDFLNNNIQVITI